MKRQSKNLASSLEHRLNSYALAASAAGAGMLALAQPSEARIVYRKADIVISTAGMRSYDLDLNQDGIIDFVLYATYESGRGYHFAELRCKGSARSNVWGKQRYESALRQGVRIGPKGRFSASGISMAYVINVTNVSTKFLWPWANGGKGVKNRYLGLKFPINGKTHFGWARLNVEVTGQPAITATLTGYAYETVPNKPIIAGKTHGKDVVTVEPTSLGALAAGASGLRTWR
jgi:hypothetical protein